MAAALKVCIFTETYFPVIGGGETQARLLAEGLARQGCQVMILTRRSDRSLPEVETIGDVRIYRLPPSGRQHLKKWGLLLFSFPALFRLRNQYDVILVSGFRVIGVSAVLMSKLLRKTCFLKADNNGELSGEFFARGLQNIGVKTGSWLFKVFLQLRNRILKSADGFIAISGQIAGEFAKTGMIPVEKIYRIPNSVDINVFHPVSVEEKLRLREQLGLLQKEKLVIFTGRLVSYKGLPVLLNVWKELSKRHTDAGLILVGGGSMDLYNCEEALRRFVVENGLDESVMFAGEVRNVHQYLQASDIFVFPTEKEAFGIALIEAMACGLPVVSTHVGGLRDILVDGQNGLVFQPGDEQALCRYLESLLVDSSTAVRLGQAALHTARSLYGSDTVTGEYLNLLRGSRFAGREAQ